MELSLNRFIADDQPGSSAPGTSVDVYGRLAAQDQLALYAIDVVKWSITKLGSSVGRFCQGDKGCLDVDGRQVRTVTHGPSRCLENGDPDLVVKLTSCRKRADYFACSALRTVTDA